MKMGCYRMKWVEVAMKKQTTKFGVRIINTLRSEEHTSELQSHYTGSIHWDSWDQCHANKSNKKEAYANESSQSMHSKWDDWDELHVSKPGTGGETVTVSHTSTATGGMDNWAEWDNLNHKRVF